MEQETAAGNLITGMVGALLGSLVGGVLWVAIYKLGYIAGLAGLVCTVLALKGYEKFGGTPDRKGVIACLAVVLATMLLAHRLSWAWEAYDVLAEYGVTFRECFAELDEIIRASELRAIYWRDFVMGCVLTLLSAAGSISKAFRK